MPWPPWIRLGLFAWLVVPRCATAGPTLAHDVMPILRRADVCANDGQCTPARVAESADTAGTLDGPVLLRPGEGRDLYVRLADAPDIELDVDATGATLHLEVAAEGTTERRAVDSPVKGRRTIRVALAPFAGRVTRLALRVVGEEPTSQITIRTATLRGSLSAEAPLVQRPVSPADRPPNVIVYVIDTLRADHPSRPVQRRGGSPAAGVPCALRRNDHHHGAPRLGWRGIPARRRLRVAAGNVPTPTNPGAERSAGRRAPCARSAPSERTGVRITRGWTRRGAPW